MSDKPDFTIGIDVGTSSVKAIAFSAEGEVLGEAGQGYPLLSPEEGAAIQDPDLICRAMLWSLRTLLGKMGRHPLAIGLSSAMHALIAVDGHGNPLTPCLTWADTRAHAVARRLRGTPSGHAVYEATGTPIHSMSPLVKLAWLQETQPELFRRAAFFAGIKEYLLFQLFGRWVTDQSLASATGLMNLHTRQWYLPALDLAGIGPERLPELVAPGFILPPLAPSMAQSLGLSPDTPWVIGASDGCLANLGAGVLTRGHAALTIGTSAAVRVTTREPLVDPLARLFCYLLAEDLFVIGGATNNGGTIWDWCCREFFAGMAIDEALAAAARIPAGAEGLFFQPYLYGERAPLWDEKATGAFHGIQARHTRAHFARAVLEGILLNLRLIAQALGETLGPLEKIYANGGFARSPFWVQMLADVLGKPVIISDHPHASAWGAALVARSAVEKNIRLERLFRQPKENHYFYPNPTEQERYEQLQKQWMNTIFEQ